MEPTVAAFRDATGLPGTGGPSGPGTIGEPFPLVLAAAQANAPWAFEALYRSVAGQVCGYLRLQGASEPEDLTSEVFLGVFRSLAGFRGTEAGFRSWVFTIAHRRLVDERRSQQRRPLLVHGDHDEAAGRPGGDAEGEAVADLAQGEVRRVLRSLPGDQRDVLLLRVVAGFTVEDVAGALGKTTAAVKALQRRGLVTLRQRVDGELAPL